jgi:hypothetical protein
MPATALNIQSVALPREGYTLKQVFMYNTNAKIKGEIHAYISERKVQNRENKLCIIS